LGMVALLRPYWRTDASLPMRFDKLIAADKRLGSRDRRLYRELVYTAVRYLPWIEPLLDKDPPATVRRIAWLAADTAAARPFREEVAAGMPACPAAVELKAAELGVDAAALNPAWLAAECADACVAPLRDIMLARAPLWLRFQTDRPEVVLSELDELGIAWKRSDLVPDALELPPEANISRTDSYATGMIEIQDIGSQLVLRKAGIAEGGHWLDACAGAGGKTLQLAAMLGSKGRVHARDIRRSALEELSRRAFRSGVGSRISIEATDTPKGGFDGVLVDAPCTGSGTWRRSPHLRWVTSQASIDAAAALQVRLLSENAPNVRAGGTLVYSTCSLCASENAKVVEKFLMDQPGFEATLPGLSLLPPSHDGDAFFVASFRRSG
jgi:16S rRNA (cytosine967-C5)-methyltransferase